MNEATAWRVLGVVFKRRTGLCLAAHRLCEAGLITRRTRRRMETRINDEARVRNLVGWWVGPVLDAGDDHPRQKMARRFAAEATLKPKAKKKGARS
jgi:anti-sigma-K factor RskA